MEKLIEKLRRENGLNSIEFKTLLERTYQELDNEKNYNLCLSAICNVAEHLPNDDLICQLLYDCMIKSRIFLYTDMLSKIGTDFTVNTTIEDLYAKSFYTLDTDTTLTKGQKHIINEYEKYNRIVVSAPTSYGKSRIIEEIIQEFEYKRIAIIVPTIALLNETYIRIKSNKAIYEKYNIINSLFNSGSIDSEYENNIYILTPERMITLIEEKNDLNLDFFVMDEIYKIDDENDERSRFFTYCLYKLSNMVDDFYLVGPYFENFSANFCKKKSTMFLEMTEEIVQKNIYRINEIPIKKHYEINGKKLTKFKSKDVNLKHLLSAISEQTLVYVGNQKRSTETRAKYISNLRKKTQDKNNDLIEYIKKIIDPDWVLVECLQAGVAFHHAGIPKYIQNEIIEFFNAGTIEIIVCTSTIIEGVNTSAKNVILYDTKKGIESLTGFDGKNIEGRAGRFGFHFTGNAFYLDPLKAKTLDNIKFRYFDSPVLNNEEIIQIDKKDLNRKNKIKRERIRKKLKQLDIPFELIKLNKFIPIDSQVNLIQELRRNSLLREKCFFTGNTPSRNNLSSILQLCHEHLFNTQDAENRNFSIQNLIRLTNYYIFYSPSLKQIIQSVDNQERPKQVDTLVRNAFTLISHYFEFALPRYLSAFEKLYNFILESGGDQNLITLKYVCTMLEYGYVNDHEIALKESGLPPDIIRKVAPVFSKATNIFEIRNMVNSNPNLVHFLNPFEKKIFYKYI